MASGGRQGGTRATTAALALCALGAAAATSGGDVTFAPGPALTPAATALAHLDRLGADPRPRLVRLPIVVAFDALLAIVDARLGQAADAPRVVLDDGALGIGLSDRARVLCAAGQRCPLRLVGYWRGSADGVGRLDVRRVDGSDPGAPASAERIEVEVAAEGREP